MIDTLEKKRMLDKAITIAYHKLSQARERCDQLAESLAESQLNRLLDARGTDEPNDA